MQRDRNVNPQQKRSEDAAGDQLGDLRERMAKVETICKYGFPGLGAYITILKFAPTSPPVKGVSAVVSAIARQFT